MSQFKQVVAVVSAVDIGPAIACDKTPFLGGAGRECGYSIPVLPITSTVLLQGNNAIDEPAEADTGWTTILTITSASQMEGEIELPSWIRWNTTVLDADGPDVAINLHGNF